MEQLERMSHDRRPGAPDGPIVKDFILAGLQTLKFILASYDLDNLGAEGRDELMSQLQELVFHYAAASVDILV